MLCLFSVNLFAYTLDGADKTISYIYDNGNRVTLLADSINGNIGYTYDKVGRITRIDQAAGAINNNQAQAIQFTYDDAGRLTKTTYANGITRDNSYDDAGQLTSITYKKADNSLIGDLAYTYDANGRRTKTSGSLAKTDLPDTISSASYDANNRLTTWSSQILSYDKNGNLTSDGLKTYIWNARNQLIQIKDSTNAETASFTYDALGRRQTKTVNGVSTDFMYDGVNIVQELNGASPINNYISGGVDQVFVQQSGAGSSASSLTYITDALGSTIRLTNATGDKVVDYSYDPYGNTRADAVIDNSFQYTGRENDGTGLYYYRARYYSPAMHRFISEDPIGLGGGINTYGYVEGDPISFNDPTGLAPDVMGLLSQRYSWATQQKIFGGMVCDFSSKYATVSMSVLGVLAGVPRPQMSAGEIGKDIILWGRGQTAADVATTVARAKEISPAIVKQMVRQGLKKDWVVQQLAQYTKAFEEGGKKLLNQQLIPRIELLKNILQNWEK